MEALRILLIIILLVSIPMIVVISIGMCAHIWRITPEQMETARQKYRDRKLVLDAMKRKFYD